jgi:hypothetical protein
VSKHKLLAALLFLACLLAGFLLALAVYGGIIIH